MANVIVVSETPQRVIIRDEAATRTVKVVAQGPQGPSGNVNPLMFQMLDQATSAATSASADAAAAQTSSASAFASSNSAQVSADAAMASEQAAALSAAGIDAKVTAAGASATSASTSATNAAASATSAAGSAASAQASANAVIDKANIADAAAASATLSAATATTKSSEAATSATNSASSAASAASSAATATTKASEASTSATNSATSATLAQDWAIKTAAPVSGSEYSSKYHALAAASHAVNASGSATAAAASSTTASTKATEAAASATSAQSSATAASGSATAANNSAVSAAAAQSAVATSATNAANSATAASNSATSAAGSATSAGNSATGASSSAVSAAGSASTATTKAGEAATSATNAATSATQAASSAASALQAKNDAIAALGTKLDVNAAQFGGNAASATKLATARTLTVGSTGKTFDGTANVGFTLTEIGAAAATHAHAITDVNALALPDIKPSLLLDFANTKRLDSRITFTRASTATYWGGKTFAKAEENLLIRSQEFDSASWVKGGVGITVNGGVAPDGSSTAELLVESTSASDNHRVYQSVTFPANSTNTLSIYAKVASGARYAGLRLGVSATSFAHCVFDLSAGTYSLGASATSANIENVGGGWFRLSMTATNTVGGLENPVFYISDVATPPAAGAGGPVYTGDGASGFYIWGAQLEERSQATAYTPTTTQPITKYQPVLRTAASGAARFDHNPVTGESLGLLVEEQRTNLLTYSGNLSAINLTAGSRAANALVAPDGSLSASIINGTGGATASTWTQSATATAATMTFSCYLKTGLPSSVASFLFLVRNSTTGKDFSTGSFNQVTGAITGTGWSSAHVGNGWYRISYTNQASEVITVGNVITCYLGAAGGIIYPTSAALCIWGIQLEAGAFPTSYIPTTTAQATRASDSAVMTGANFSSWCRQDEGAFVSEAAPSSMSALNMCVVAATDGTDNNVIGCFADAGYNLYVYKGGATQAALSSGAYSAGAFSKNAASYSLNAFAASLNSGAVASDSSGLVPSLSRLWIGVFANNYRLNGHIRKIAYYPRRLSNAELQALTA